MSNPPTIPDHTLRRPIGRGAYGEVWLARNVMGAPRAVKIVWRRQFESDRPYEREFAGIQRYEPVSRCADGLVHVLHVGRNDTEGYFYYVMELADPAMPDCEEHLIKPEAVDHLSEPTPLVSYAPRTLRSDMKRIGRLPVGDCLRVALDVVGGLARLHDRGLLHRDVKPGNIIFVEGRAKLADIGLVTVEGEKLTFVGTEGYIPPEGPGSPAADLYALGMVLYEAVTGYPPERFPKVPPEWFAKEASTDALEFHTVVLKACEGARERRYQSAEEMQADLALLQSGQSVRHLRALEERVSRWRKIGAAAAIVVGLAVGTSLVANWRARVAAETQAKEAKLLQQATNSLMRAESAEREARQQLNAALFEQARALVLSRELGHRTRSLDAIRRAGGATNAAELRRVIFAALALPDLQLESEARFELGVTLLQPDPAFQRVAMGRGTGAVNICSLPALEVITTLPATTSKDAYTGIWSPDGRYLAIKRQNDTAGIRSEWEVWEVEKGRHVFTIGPSTAHGSVTFHPRRPVILAGHGGGTITEWDLNAGRQVRKFKFPATPHALAYSPDGRQVGASYRMGSKWVLAFHDADELELLRTVDWPEGMEIMTWHPHGRWIAGCALNASTWARGVRLVEPETGRITMLGEHKIKTANVAFTADGGYLVSGGWDREIICWDLDSMRRSFTHAGKAYHQTWSADGRHCAIILPEGMVQLYGFELPRDRNLFGNPGEDIYAGQFSPDGQWFVSRDNQQLCVWNVGSHFPAVIIATPRVVSAFFTPDSSELYAVPSEYSQRGYMGRWRLIPGTNELSAPRVEALPIEIPKGVTWAGFVSSNFVMTTAEEVRLTSSTNFTTGDARALPAPSWRGCVSNDGQWLATLYHFSSTVIVYRLPDLEEVARLTTSNIVGFVTFSPESNEMLLINRSGVECYDTATWKRTRHQPGTPVSGSYAFYTPDGKGIWSVTHFRNAALLDRQTGEPILPLPNDVLPLALSPDGRQLAVSVDGRRVRLWDLAAFRAELDRLGLNW